jgi:hypothetical protein
MLQQFRLQQTCFRFGTLELLLSVLQRTTLAVHAAVCALSINQSSYIGSNEVYELTKIIKTVR